MIGMIVDRLHVSSTPLQVVRAVHRAMTLDTRSARDMRDARKSAYRKALQRHRENRDTFLFVMRGR